MHSAFYAHLHVRTHVDYYNYFRSGDLQLAHAQLDPNCVAFKKVYRWGQFSTKGDNVYVRGSGLFEAQPP
jgi:hypothetical protein